MKKAEISFPRGKPPKPFLGSDAESLGKAVKKHKSKDTEERFSARSDDLFKIGKTSAEEKSAKKKKKRSGLTSDETDLLSSETTEKKGDNVISVLSYETISEGMLSLGRIMKVRDHEILVSLPGRTMGSVPITSISAPYTKALETLTADGASEDPIYGVEDLFQAGQLVSVAVTGVKREGHSYKVTLSMTPNDLQASYTAGCLCESMLLTGAVASVEDHGYIIDVGIPDTSAFIPKANATAFLQKNHKRALGIGQLLKCKIVTVKAVGRGGAGKAHLTLSINPKETNNVQFTMETINNYQLLLPGMESEGTVMKTHRTGLKVDFLDMVGHVHLDHMTDPWTLPESLDIGATIFPRVLYTLPNSTNPALTLQAKLCSKKPSTEISPTLTLGSKVKVKVARIEKRGLIVRFEGGERGFVAATRCSDNSALTDEDIGKTFPVGSSHLCCVLEYSALDNMYIASFQQSVVNQSVVRIDQLAVGEVVSCELKSWKPTGAIVGVGLAKGFIPKMHFGELVLKNPAVKFPIGCKFKARVCRIDLLKNQMMLTAKKRLVKSQLALLSTFEECTYGTAAEGVINRVTEHGINIYTIGGLPAFIPATKATLEDRHNLPKLFFPGQVVQFHVIDANKKENRIILSLLFDEAKFKAKSAPVPDAEGQRSQSPVKKTKKRQPDKEQISEGQRSQSPSKSVKKTKKRQEEAEQIEVVEESSAFNGEGAAASKKAKKDKKVKKGRKAEEEVEEAPPKKKSKRSKKAESMKEGAESACLECPGDSFYDTSYLAETKDESDSELSGDEATPAQKKRKDKKAKAISENKAKESEPESEPKAGKKFSASSVAEFEKLLLSSPNDGKLWCSYINFVLQGAELEEARSVAARGIRTILFREEAERELIWKLWLSIEASQGTEESLKNVFAEALKANDPLTIYQAMAEIHRRNKNIKEQENLVHLMTKKFPEVRAVWFDAVDFYYKNSELDKGRTVFKTSLEKLPKTEHILMISKTAVLEIKHGDIERGRTLLDTTLQTYPKRMDLWLLYAAQLIKKGESDMAREVYENAVKVPFVPKRMLSLLKSYLNFENEHGTAENRARVKAEALKYVNSTMPKFVEAFQDDL